MLFRFFCPQGLILWISKQYSPYHWYILYMICWSLGEINVFFEWGDPVMPVDKGKVWNIVYWQPCMASRFINTYKVEVPLIFSLWGRYFKMVVERRGNTANISWCSLYHVMTCSFLMSICASAAFQNTLNSDSTLSLKIYPLLEAFLGPPTVSALK